MGEVSTITQLQVPVYVTTYFLKITIMANITATHPVLQKINGYFKTKLIKSDRTGLILNKQF